MQVKIRLLARCAHFVRLSRTPLVVALVLGLSVAALAQVPATPSDPKGPIVSDLIIQGNRQVSAEQIRNMIKTRPGKEYVPDTVQADTRTLYATRQFGNVYFDVKEDGPGKVKVIIHIRDYPNTVQKVTYQGHRALSRDDLDQIVNIRKGMPLNPIANKVACRRIVQRYNEEGRPFASCDLIKGADPGDTEVIFNITEGPKVKVTDIKFTGNSFVYSNVLKNRINSSSKILGLFGGTYNPAMVDADVNKLLEYYRAFGYHDARVSRELQYSADGRSVVIVFHIHEGTRYRIQGSPTVQGVKSMGVEALEALNKVRPGDYYDQGKIDGDLGRIRDWLGYQGHETKTKAVPVYPPETPGVVRVQYQVEEQQPKKVGQIFIVGNERTRQNVILRQVPLYPGQILSYPDLRVGERNLARLNIFEASPDGAVRPTITVLENPMDPDNPYRDILINVQEASTGSLLFGVGVNSDTGLTGSVVLNERNFDITRLPTSLDDFINGSAFRGAGQEFRLEAVPGTQLQRYTASFREPFLFDSPYSLTVSGYYFERIFNEYEEQRLGGRVTLGRKVSDYWSILATARVENVAVANVPFYAPEDYRSVVGNNFLAGFRIGATRDSRDSFLRPTEGSVLDVGFEQCIGEYTFPLVSADFTKYFTTYSRADGSGKHVLALHSQASWAGSNTPVYERFFAGGFRSIRGFQFRGVSPEVNGFKVGGDFMALNSLEYQIPVRANDQIYVVGFVDSGTVAERIDEIKDYRVTAGFGVRFVVPMLGPVPIALDFGFPIVKGPTDNQQVFNFWMGFFR